MIYHIFIFYFFLFQQLAVLPEAVQLQLSLLEAEGNQFPLLAEVGQHQLAEVGQHLGQQ